MRVHMPQEEENVRGAAAAFAGIIIWCYLLVVILAFAFPNLVFWLAALILLIPASVWAWRRYSLRYEAKKFVKDVERELNK